MQRPQPETAHHHGSRPRPPRAPALLISCYELGHQPLNLAWPAAALAALELTVRVADLSVASFPEDVAARAGFVAISAPMHTAMRLGVEAARRVRACNPRAHIAFFGHYAWLNREYLLSEVGDSVIGGEVEETLARLARAVLDGEAPEQIPGVSTRDRPAEPVLTRLGFRLPARDGLPELQRYARLIHGDDTRLAGYVEASRGCLHTCRHCPITPVYRGRFFVVQPQTVLADIRQQVAAGAGHITFGDPDFLNGPGHSLAVVRALHAEFPTVTFDFTTKVEHILQHRTLFPELEELGAAFVVSAFEHTSDPILQRLAKGHTRADLTTALEILQQAGLAVQPTWMPFTPWTTPDDYLELLDWIRNRNLIPNVPAVQLSIRMLVPPGSALTDHDDGPTWLGPLDPAGHSHHWVHPNPEMDALQQAVAQLAEGEGDQEPYGTFRQIEGLAAQVARRPAPNWQRPLHPPPRPPRLTEDWFC